MSYEAVADSDLAAVVTFLEMRERRVALYPRHRSRLALIEHPRTDDYRRLFRLVGARGCGSRG